MAKVLEMPFALTARDSRAGWLLVKGATGSLKACHLLHNLAVYVNTFQGSDSFSSLCRI